MTHYTLRNVGNYFGVGEAYVAESFNLQQQRREKLESHNHKASLKRGADKSFPFCVFISFILLQLLMCVYLPNGTSKTPFSEVSNVDCWIYSQSSWRGTDVVYYMEFWVDPAKGDQYLL
jgi:hypothetical protein